MSAIIALIIVIGVSFIYFFLKEDGENKRPGVRNLKMLEDLLKVADITKCEHERQCVSDFEQMISKYGYRKIGRKGALRKNNDD